MNIGGDLLTRAIISALHLSAAHEIAASLGAPTPLTDTDVAPPTAAPPPANASLVALFGEPPGTNFAQALAGLRAVDPGLGLDLLRAGATRSPLVAAALGERASNPPNPLSGLGALDTGETAFSSTVAARLAASGAPATARAAIPDDAAPSYAGDAPHARPSPGVRVVIDPRAAPETVGSRPVQDRAAAAPAGPADAAPVIAASGAPATVAPARADAAESAAAAFARHAGESLAAIAERPTFSAAVETAAQRPDLGASVALLAAGGLSQGERAGVVASMMLNAAMIPGWPGPLAYANAPAASDAVAPHALQNPALTETDIVTYLANFGVSAPVLEKLRPLFGEASSRKSLLLHLAILLSAFCIVFVQIKSELDAIVEEFIRRDEAGDEDLFAGLAETRGGRLKMRLD